MTKKISTDVKKPPQLATRHYEWIFAAAQEHFADQIERMELDTVRHQTMLQEETATNYHTTGIGNLARKDRAEKIKRNRDYLIQYREIINWLALVRERVMEVSAEDFAESFWANRKK